MKSTSPEEWRKFFDSGNCSIYQIINHAIRVAASDDPEEFKLRRKKIVERLYSCQFTGCCCCADQTELDVHSTVTQVFQDCKKTCVNKSSTKVDNSAARGGRATDQADEVGNNNEDDRENIRCVLQIKQKLENSDELTETEIYESLKKLQLLVKSVDIMEATKIGKTISDLQRHPSKQISLFARTIADQWKSMIVELVNSRAETTVISTNPKPNLVLEEWREFPAAEFVPQPPVEFSEKKFLDDMDDYENAAIKENNETEDRQKNAAKENETELKQKQESSKREKAKKQSISNEGHTEVEKIGAMEKNPSVGHKRKQEVQLIEDAELIAPVKRQKATPPRQESIHQKPNPRPPRSAHTSSRNQKPRVEKKGQNHKSETCHRYRALRINADPRNASPRGRESRRSSDNTAMEEKLESTKKKLHAGYQAHEKAKRNIQLIPEGDLHKKASSRRSSRIESKKQTRR